MNTKILYALLGVAILLAACTPTDNVQEPTGAVPDAPQTDTPPAKETTGEVVELSLVASDWAWTPSTLTVHNGDRVRITVTSESGTHGLAIPVFGVKTDEFGPGETRVVEFTADQVGSYVFSCNVFCGEGHREMKGEFVVLE